MSVEEPKKIDIPQDPKPEIKQEETLDKIQIPSFPSFKTIAEEFEKYYFWVATLYKSSIYWEREYFASRDKL